MGFTEQQYLDLVAAIALGAVEVKYGDKTVKYRSLEEMKTLANQMADALNRPRPFNSGVVAGVADYSSGK